MIFKTTITEEPHCFLDKKVFSQRYPINHSWTTCYYRFFYVDNDNNNLWYFSGCFTNNKHRSRMLFTTKTPSI